MIVPKHKEGVEVIKIFQEVIAKKKQEKEVYNIKYIFLQEKATKKNKNSLKNDYNHKYYLTKFKIRVIIQIKYKVQPKKIQIH